MAAVPDGARRCVTLSHWLPLITSALRDERTRVDRAVNFIKICHGMLNGVDPTSRTAMPGHEFLMAYANVSRTTVKNCLRWLKARGFLGVVAEGRQGKYAQKNADGHELYPSKTGERTNERAVYVLCEPLGQEALELMAEAEAQHAKDLDWLVAVDSEKLAVDISCLPIPTSVGTNPPHAREKECEQDKDENDGAPRRLKSFFEARSARFQDLRGNRPAPLWPGRATTDAKTKRGTRANQLLAALTIQDRSFALRQISAKHLAYVCRPFFEAGWTVNDILEAIDHRPDGSRHRHDGADGVGNVAGWLAHRLGFWKCNGVVTYSPYQRREKRAEVARSRAIEAARAYRAPVKPQVSGMSEVARRTLSEIRAMFKR